jgi:hypothetical protein
LNDTHFLLVDKGFDTLKNEFVLILFEIDKQGNIIRNNVLPITPNEANNRVIKHVIKLHDDKLLVILWNYFEEYTFFYFNDNLEFNSKTNLSLGRGIRNLKETPSGDFICTSLAYDNNSFQLYRFDTSGAIKWTITPYSSFGTARDLVIKNDSLFVVGGIGLQFSVFMICDLNGQIFKNYKYNSFYCKSRFCNLFLESDNSFVIGAYAEHCDTRDNRGSDIAILGIDTQGEISWERLYNFKSALGTTDPNGYYTDFGVTMIDKTTDGSFVTNGVSRYSRLTPGGVLHEDALLIKTEPIITSNKYSFEEKVNNYKLMNNLIETDLILIGPIENIINWRIFSPEGNIYLHGKRWTNSLSPNILNSGLYFLTITDKYNSIYNLKFFINN